MWQNELPADRGKHDTLWGMMLVSAKINSIPFPAALSSAQARPWQMVLAMCLMILAPLPREDCAHRDHSGGRFAEHSNTSIRNCPNRANSNRNTQQAVWAIRIANSDILLAWGGCSRCRCPGRVPESEKCPRCVAPWSDRPPQSIQPCLSSPEPRCVVSYIPGPRPEAPSGPEGPSELSEP